jgi:hypothetical protein
MGRLWHLLSPRFQDFSVLVPLYSLVYFIHILQEFKVLTFSLSSYFLERKSSIESFTLIYQQKNSLTEQSEKSYGIQTQGLPKPMLFWHKVLKTSNQLQTKISISFIYLFLFKSHVLFKAKHKPYISTE